LNFLVDENMPRSLASLIAALGFIVQDVRDMGLRGRPDTEVFEAALAADEIIITRDRGFAILQNWPGGFTAGVIFVNLPDNTTATIINKQITDLLAKRSSTSLLGAITIVEPRRALSRVVRKRPEHFLFWSLGDDIAAERTRKAGFQLHIQRTPRPLF
jgi:predicted nuclease of predicted toxin-antitoxin system